MSRTSIKTFLSVAKKHLQTAIKTEGHVSLVVGNESADLDSIISALVYGYIQSNTLSARREQKVIVPVTNIPGSDLSLRPELTTLLKHADLQPSDIITLDDLEKLPLPLKDTDWTLVDHNELLGNLGKTYSGNVHGVIDHHKDEQKVPEDAKPRVIEKSGSCSSLVVNYCREAWDETSSRASSVGAANAQDQSIVDDTAYTSTWDAQIAKLAIGAVLVDTVNMTADTKVTEHDKKAVRYLEAVVNASAKVGTSYDRDSFYQELNTAKSDLDNLSVDDILRKDYKQWSEGGLVLGISSVVKPIEYLLDKNSELMETVLKFAERLELDICAIMTAYTTKSGDFARQLLTVTVTKGKAKIAVERFFQCSADELELADCPVSLGIRSDVKILPWQMWEAHSQKNLAASRKQVGPLLREAMR